MKNTLIIILLFSFNSNAHNHQAQATYLGNEGIMIVEGGYKILFDPFFHNGYNNYQLVPDDIRHAIFNNKPPYDAIDAIFISHAHGDHFAADDMLKFLDTHPNTKLIAPNQAIMRLKVLKGSGKIMNQTTAIKLNYGDKEQTINFDGLHIEVVRIPHAGWPGRAQVENLVFRVTLNNTVTVMHMGDADPNESHFTPHKKHWKNKRTTTAFPPYWFFTSEDGQIILDEHLNVESSVGIHVPIKIPASLEMTGKKYFSKPSETINLVGSLKEN